jgi:hypothetical protein
MEPATRRWSFRLGFGEQRSSYGTRSIMQRIFSPPPRRPPFECFPSVSRRDAELKILCIMESATLWKVDATEAALRAEAGLDRFP